MTIPSLDPSNIGDPGDAPERLLRHKVNPCDIDRYSGLAPLGDALHALWKGFTLGTDCTCCLGARLVALTVVTAGVTVLATLTVQRLT